MHSGRECQDWRISQTSEPGLSHVARPKIVKLSSYLENLGPQMFHGTRPNPCKWSETVPETLIMSLNHKEKAEAEQGSSL